MHVNMLAQWCPMVSKTHWTEAKSLDLKLNRMAANPAMEGAHKPSAKSITTPRKIKTKQKQKRTSTSQKLKNIKATLKPKHTFKFLLNFYYLISFSVPFGDSSSGSSSQTALKKGELLRMRPRASRCLSPMKPK